MCIINAITEQEYEYLSLKLSTGERFLRRTQVLRSVFIAWTSACVRACVLACMRAWAKYRKVRTIFFSSSSIFSPSPFAPPFSLSFFSSSLASHSPEAKDARVLLRLTFSGMNYLARQIPDSAPRYYDFAIRRKITRCVSTGGINDNGIITLSNCRWCWQWRFILKGRLIEISSSFQLQVSML